MVMRSRTDSVDCIDNYQSEAEEEKTYYDKVNKNQHIFDEEFGLISRPNKRRSSLSGVEHRLTDMKKSITLDAITGFFPILKWLPAYNVKEDLFNDIIGGLTVGIMHVPQGMAYATLTGLRPVTGLYTSLLPALFYMIFGTSRHVSVGVFSVVSLMVGSCNLRTTQILVDKRFSDNDTGLLDEVEFENLTYGISMEIVTALALLVGMIQISMGLLRLDFLTSYLSDQVITGFTTGASVHVFTAELNKIFGVSLPRHNGVGKLFLVYGDLWNSVVSGNANLSTFLISIVTLMALFIAKNVVDPVIKKKLNFQLPIPYDLFVMIIGTTLSFVMVLKDNYNVKVIGEIPTGFPSPSIPNLNLLPMLFSDAIAISIVILVVTISMGKLFAKKHSYEIDVRQEFYALGAMECLSSLFPVWPASTALARTLVYEAAGTKTQLATIFSSLLLLAVIFWIGPVLEGLPTCFLSCIIIVALQGMFMPLKEIGPLWKISRGDAAVFLVTCIATVVFDVTEGLAIGVLFALGQVVFKTQRSRLVELGRMSHTKDRIYYQPIAEYRDSTVTDGVACLRYTAPLVFLNVEEFRRQLSVAIEAPSIARRKHLQVQQGQKKNEPIMRSRNNSAATGQYVMLAPGQAKDADCISSKLSTLDSNKISMSVIRAVVVDMSAVPFIDYMGATTIVEVFVENMKNGIRIFYCGISSEIMATLQLFPIVEEKLGEYIFPTIEDAIQAASEEIKIQPDEEAV